VYSYGDGFQYMRPIAKDEDDVGVSFMVPLDVDKLMVIYSDNSIELLELPTMVVVDELPASWIGTKNGNITAVHNDEPGEKNYTYIGTSEGVLQVLDVLDTSIRVCDFTVTHKTLGVSKPMSITDIQMYPKEEKYVAISFASEVALVGAVVIFDFSKMKAHRQFDTKAVACLSWNSTGEALYAGIFNLRSYFYI
jgi:hypothetical protein